MADLTADTPTFALQPLWQHLARELAPIYDVHSACAIIAHETTQFTGMATGFALLSFTREHADIWIALPGQDVMQTRLPAADLFLQRVLAATEPFWTDGPTFGPDASALLPREPVAAVAIMRHAPLDYDLPPGAVLWFAPEDSAETTITRLRQTGEFLSTYVERAALMRYVQRQQVTSDIVQHVSHELTSNLRLDRIYETVANPIRHMLNVETVSIGLVEPETGDVVFVSDLMEESFRQAPLRLQAGQGIAGWVATHGESVISNDVYHDTRFYARVDQMSGFRTRSILCVPLIIEGQVIGIVEAINKHLGHFNDNDLALVQGIASALAIALANARLHTAVLAEKRRIETMFANLAEGIITVDAAGVISAANDAAANLLSLPVDQLLGHDVTSVLRTTPTPFAQFMHQTRQAADTQPFMACSIRHDSDDDVPVLLSGAAIYDDSGATSELVFVLSDLRELREIERMRDDFFHNIVHELRTPVATILMYVRLVRNLKESNPGKFDHYMSMLELASDRLQTLVRDMLEVAKLESREALQTFTAVLPRLMLNEIVGPLTEQAAQKGVKLVADIADDLPPMQADPQVLYSVFKNLIENAVKFTFDGQIAVTAAAADGWLHFRVQDHGIGIPQAALPKLFGRFYRTSTAVERSIAGSGLGLYMVKYGVDMHGGTIDVQSHEGVGTTFSVRLPLNRPGGYHSPHEHPRP